MEVNPSLMQERDAQQTIAIGCSLIRSAFGEWLRGLTLPTFADGLVFVAGETLL